MKTGTTATMRFVRSHPVAVVILLIVLAAAAFLILSALFGGGTNFDPVMR
ncbi:hypothetical protein IHQ68_13180 [Chelatococcus sambhunathii]|uniref:ABC transporter permease n=1 Tax=Chelatococcus sambhunathii TaxID=363953 RepID=A0ABU1DHF8_9HYPH|nr:hypothetical protein [Chelatococcus sambhunathii]MDR4307571.1 hypothetical protein [Chelatococcus sambhunathii]